MATPVDFEPGHGQENKAYVPGQEETIQMPLKPRDPELQKELLDSDASIITAGSDAAVKKKSGLLSMIKRYPKGVFFMLGNEFCERFSFYGMRAVLTLYFITIHEFQHSTAKMLFHLFISICYLTPLFGSLLADGFIGRFKVILYGSILYCIGHVLLTSGAMPGLGYIGMSTLDFSGLLVIAIATGAIKPCVSTFAADQFSSDLALERESFFSFFYFAINAGALSSKIITPILRGRVKCMGESHCFPAAFGLPAVLMVVATVVFIVGKPFYTIQKSTDNIIAKVGSLLCYAVRRRLSRSKSDRRDHWLDYADDRFDKALISDVKRILKVLVLFIPIILFWALFDQQGSTWVLQATRMDGHLGYLTILPDQMSVSNPFLVIVLVPFITAFVYPLFHKYDFLNAPLKRMGAGGILTSLSFVIAGLVQLWVNKSLIVYPEEGHSRIFVQNNLPCNLNLLKNEYVTDSVVSEHHLEVDRPYLPRIVVDDACSSRYQLRSTMNVTEFAATPRTAYFVTTLPGTGTSADLRIEEFPLTKTTNGESKLIFVVAESLRSNQVNKTSKVFLFQEDRVHAEVDIDENGYAELHSASGFGPNHYDVILRFYRDSPFVYEELMIEKSFPLDMGPVHAFTIWNTTGGVSKTKLVEKNTVKLFWQFPQYVMITTGEIFLSVTGMEFAYSQAPASMKSVLAAAWLLTVTFGNFIDMAISGSNLFHEAHVEFFFYAALMAGVMIIFGLLARNYEYFNEYETVDSVGRTFPEESKTVELKAASKLAS